MDVNILRGKSLLSYNSGSNAYTGSLSVADTAYVNGGIYLMYVSAANTSAAPTVNYNLIGAKALVKNKNTALAVGDLISGRWYYTIYDSPINSFRVIDLGI